MDLLKIDDLNKLKFTYITNVIHFKYDDEYYYIHERCDYIHTTALYKGRSIIESECINATYGMCINLIKHKNNENTLSSIDKENFVKKLYAMGIIDTNNELKKEVENKQKRLKELNDVIRKAQEEIRKIDWEE